MSTLTLAIDPGECTGLAWGVERDLVAVASAVPGDELVLPAVLAEHGNPAPGVCVIEIPRFYPPRVYGSPKKATAIGNSLIREAITLGGWAQQARDQGYTVQEEYPRTWKGTVNKRAMCMHVIALLTREERRMVSATLKASKLAKSKIHNVLDAIGIFFWKVGRL